MRSKHISTLIRKRRLDLKLTQEQLSKRLGYKNLQYISNIERELCSFPPKRLLDLSSALCVTPKDIKDALIMDFIESIDGELNKTLSTR